MSQKISLKKTLDKWKKTGIETTRLILNSHIYEYYCYDKIISDNPDIHIILSKTQKSKLINGFVYRNNGSIYYTQHDIDLAEFDILGLDDQGTLYWWEVTTAKTNEPKVKKKLNKKIELVYKLFDKVNFSLIVPEEIDFLNTYPKTIIPPPVYEDYYKDYYELSSDVGNCWPLKKLIDLAKPYDYIAEVIGVSKKFFSHKISEYNSHLIEHLYDIEHINENRFQYFDVRKQTLKEILIENHKMYKVEGGKKELVDQKKATSIEIRLIRKRLRQSDTSHKI